MGNQKIKTTLFFILISFLPSWSLLGQVAFPGAEGGGMYATGGRGGKVYYVNSLEDTMEGNNELQEGTLRWCLNRKGPKTILFKVAGIIRLSKPLNITDNTTVAGQSAPGDGICIADHYVRIKGENIIVRFLRFRLGDLTGVEDDALKGSGCKNVIIDHCSMSWSTDECASFYDNTDFTLQWCILSESLTQSIHRKGGHGYGGIWGGKNATFHHNLLAHHDSRNPRMCGSRYSNEPSLELVDFRNNVIYNWGHNSGYAGEGGSYNFINNYYKPSKYSVNKKRIFAPNADDGKNNQPKGVWGQFYLQGNYMYGSKEVTLDNSLGFEPNPSAKDKKELLVDKPFNTAYVTTHSAEEAYRFVLKYAGASFKRDSTDRRIVNETFSGLTPIKTKGDTGTKPGLINSQQDVGGWDDYSFSLEEVLPDANLDGIPDGWLEKHFPECQATDRNEEGYTYLEVYINQIIK
ncbi:MAG: pectate lyase [Bacteroidales bacterium]|nr:pectate lyase [Bacteroidales bacterium]